MNEIKFFIVNEFSSSDVSFDLELNHIPQIGSQTVLSPKISDTLNKKIFQKDKHIYNYFMSNFHENTSKIIEKIIYEENLVINDKTYLKYKNPTIRILYDYIINNQEKVDYLTSKLVDIIKRDHGNFYFDGQDFEVDQVRHYLENNKNLVWLKYL